MAKRVRRQPPPAADPDPEAPADPAAVEGAAGGSFESSLEELEALVDRLEAGDLPLEGALEAFERGVSLTRHCAEQLETAERRIEALVREGDTWVTRPFGEGEAEGDD